MKTWRSQAYLHFQPLVIIVEDGKTLYKFVCKKNPSISCSHKCFEDSTRNLNNHIKVCSPHASADQDTITVFASRHLYSATCFRFKLSEWCV
ncbi:hypothetical protein ARMSODRAFT_883532 [Armillaria solidipes]|uniref:Uncharacterized protein n=1 Tax=Armillaria solidipes TaxID=1076256 RepID=A0A2H3C4N9_9AGAR|nr:hypothetical protein ARMSODRAFT_883532 [Armillaria solidipes]